MLSIVVVAALLGFGLPQLASYQAVWVDLGTMPWPRTILVACAGVANLVASWVMIVTLLPSLRLRQAAVLNLGPTAAANTLPAGEAVALGISWAMLSSWGISTKQYVLYTLLSGAFNTGAKLSLPIVALAVLALAGESNTGLTVAAVTGLALLFLGATALFTALHTDTSRAQHHLQRLLTIALRRMHRPASWQLGPVLADFHQQTRALLAARGVRILLATATAHLSMALVLLTCLYASGVTQAQVPWPTALAAFAFARLLSALPITPGGLGVVELSLTGFLAIGLDGPTITKVTAAVLLFRAITYLLPIPLGAAAYLTWRSQARNGTEQRPRPTPDLPDADGTGPAAMRTTMESRDEC
ncbi:YbhN family protein [Spirillospora sp. NPDC048911]|uniref:lysylphosphatidylglycerol synthase transmembrane domain-containing protein n=1 Tax=Spirillospora sp. NPDC048911 TaxID=3364527 RepID=UPI00371B8E5D